MTFQLRHKFNSSALAVVILIALSLPGISPVLAQGPSPEARAVIQSLSDEDRQKLFSLPREERRVFIQKILQERNSGSPATTSKASKKSKGGFKGGFGGGKGKGKGKGRRRFPPPLVQLAQVTRETMVQIYPITGRLVASNKSAIASTIRGRVAEVLVKIGDRVKTGDVLARLDINRLKLEADLKAAEVIQARAKWNNAKAQVKLLNQELARLERLKRSAAFSQARFEDKQQEVVKAQTAVDETAAALRRARASRDLARVDLREAEIRAPFDGAVIIRHTSPGAYINTGNPIVTLLDDKNLEIEADVPSARLGGVRPASTIDVRLDKERSIRAKVRAVIPDENPLARTQAVRLVPNFGNNGDGVVPNQSVVLLVPHGEHRQVVAIPKDAVVERQNGKAVFVFANDRVRAAVVQIGESFASKFEVLSGLQPGQKVVVRGNEMLRPGQQVRVARRGGRPGGIGGSRPSSFSGSKGGSGIVSTLSPKERRKFFAMSPDERSAFIQKKRTNRGGTPQASRGGPPSVGRAGGFGGKGKGGGRIVSGLNPTERQKFFAMSPEGRRAFIQKKRQELRGQ